MRALKPVNIKPCRLNLKIKLTSHKNTNKVVVLLAVMLKLILSKEIYCHLRI